MSTPIEFERKFLVNADQAALVFGSATHSEVVEQAYFMQDDVRCARLRKRESQWLLTCKMATGEKGKAFEAETTVDAVFAQALWPLCPARVQKRRHYVQVGPFGWEVDQFLDHNTGLVLAEIELSTQAESDQLDTMFPAWVGQEVTGDPRYFNTWLASNVAPGLAARP